MFIDYLKLEGALEKQARHFLFKARNNPQWAEENFMRFIDFHLERLNGRDISELTISNYLKSTKLFCEMNNIT